VKFVSVEMIFFQRIEVSPEKLKHTSIQPNIYTATSLADLMSVGFRTAKATSVNWQGPWVAWGVMGWVGKNEISKGGYKHSLLAVG